MTPLFQSFMIPAVGKAMAKLARTSERPPRDHELRIYHGYAYNASMGDADGPDGEQRRAALEAMRPAFPNIRKDFERIVREELLPAYDELDRLTYGLKSREDASHALEKLVDLYETIWTLHMQIVMPVFASQELYEKVFLELFPNKTATDAHDLLVGASNQFVEADRAFAQLADGARDVPYVRKALLGPDPISALSETPEGKAFFYELESTLERFGWRVGAGHDFYQKTWREDPTPALATIRQFLESDRPFEQHWQETVARHHRLLEDVLNQLNPDQRTRFEEAFRVAWEARPIDEDHHFYIDAMLPAKARSLLVRIGEILREEGTLATSEQIFFLYRDELKNMLSGTYPVDTTHLESRRALYFQYCQETPPLTLGNHSAGEWSKGEPSGESGVIHGLAASGGVWEGAVRIIRGVNDFARLKTGEVLAARTTTPSWSGLFSTAGAVVTDSGGVLSHAATVAREYRVPCVVAARHATEELKDGDIVRVDGNQGTVTMIRPQKS